jgi:hypothetical protein
VIGKRLTLPTLLETPDYNTWKSIHRSNPLLSGKVREHLGKRCSRHVASFDLNGRVPVIENVSGVLVLNAPGQMIMKTDTDLCIVKGLCWSETARSYADCCPFLALQTLDCVNGSPNDSGVLN